MSSVDIPKDTWALLADQPLASPPPGITPSFEHPTWHGHSIVIAASICVPVMLAVASIRIYAKCYITRKWNRDDSIFLVSLAAGMLFIALAVAMTCGGAYGYHAWDVKVGQLTKSVLMRSLVLLVLSGPLVWMIKLSVFSFIYHVFRPLTYIRWLVYAGVLLTGLYQIGVAITNGILCGPHRGHDRASYMAGMAGSKCGNPDGMIQILSVTSGSVNLFTDLFLLVLPLPAVYELNLPRGRKAGVMAIFLTGSVGCVMSGLALFYRRRAYGGGHATMWNTDITYTNNPIMTVTIVESAVGVCIPCMGSIAKLFKMSSDSLSSFFNLRLTGFRRTSSHDNSFGASHAFRHLSKAPEMPHTNTIDKMMMQFKHDDNTSDTCSQGSSNTKKSQM